MSLLLSGDLRCKNYGIPAAIAGVAPTLDYRFALDRSEIEAVSLTDKLTFARNISSQYTNQSGLDELAPPNTPRFNHNATTKQSEGLQVEIPSTNLITHSDSLNVSAWEFRNYNNSTLATVVADIESAPAPYETRSVDQIVISAASSTRYFRLAASPGQTFTVSSWGRATNVNYSVNYSFGFNGIRQGIGLEAYKIGTQSQLLRKSHTFTAPSSGIDSVEVGFGAGGTSAQGSIFAWGVQLELGTQATSYIPTDGSTVTRAESATIDGTGVITGTYTLVEKPAGCAVVNGSNIDLVAGYTAERVMVFPAALSGDQIAAIRGAM